VLAKLKAWAKAIKRDVLALWLAARDPRVPWYAKALALLVAGYAMSPIDLIPDFIPVLGYLDDVVIVPLGILLVVALVPKPVMAELRARAEDMGRQPGNKVAAAIIVVVWLLAAGLAGWWVYRALT
jgi:uncharacterized membrane protein YkvA (DUF1232 family)